MNGHEATRFAHGWIARTLRNELDFDATSEEWKIGPDGLKVRKAIEHWIELHERRKPLAADRTPRPPKVAPGPPLPFDKEPEPAPSFDNECIADDGRHKVEGGQCIYCMMLDHEIAQQRSIVAPMTSGKPDKSVEVNGGDIRIENCTFSRASEPVEPFEPEPETDRLSLADEPVQALCSAQRLRGPKGSARLVPCRLDANHECPHDFEDAP